MACMVTAGREQDSEPAAAVPLMTLKRAEQAEAATFGTC